MWVAREVGGVCALSCQSWSAGDGGVNVVV